MKKKKGSGILGGLVLLVIGVCLLWYNEGRTVKATKGIMQAEKEFQKVSSLEIKPENEGKLISTSGNLILPEEELTDQTFNVSIKTAKLVRKVETYQWIESCSTDDNDKETCTYKKDWDDKLIDSSEFKQAGHDNPSEAKYEETIFTATPVKVDEFELNSDQIRKLSATEKITNLNNIEEKTGLHVNNYYYTDVKENTPEIGNVRISFYYNNYKQVSVLAVQSGNSFTSYVSKTGYKINEIVEGKHSGEEMLQTLADNNKTWKWILRIAGTFLVIIGLGALISPLQTLANYIPIIGTIFGWVTGIATFLLGLAISLIVIALAWFRYRPVMSVCFIIASVGLYIASKKLSKPKNEEIKEENSNNN